MMANGQQINMDRVLQILTDGPLTNGYRPTQPLYDSIGTGGTGIQPQIWLLRDIERMMCHPAVCNPLNYFKSGIANAEFWGGPDPNDPSGEQGLPFCAESPDANLFVAEQCQRWWNRGVPMIQGGYEYGWIGGEANYTEAEGPLKFESLEQFSPRDVFPLTLDYEVVGVRVKNVRGKGNVDLWSATEDVPAKGVWYAHQPRYNKLWGRSQLLGSWRPYTRLAGQDGQETVIDQGSYRSAFCGPVIRYPEEDLQATSNLPGTTLDSQGNPRRYARDLARQMAEQLKTGAGIGLPSTKYGPDFGGSYKWDVDWPTNVLNLGPILELVKYLCDEISKGIGVPPELLQAANTGSGYSGREIPLHSFLTIQQRIADALLHLFVDQILKPLVRWNFGPVKWNAQVKSLIKSRKEDEQSSATAQQSAAGQIGGAQGNQTQWSPYQHPSTGQSGWKSTGGRIQYGGTPPGQAMSMNPLFITDKMREISRKIIEKARRAA